VNQFSFFLLIFFVCGFLFFLPTIFIDLRAVEGFFFLKGPLSKLIKDSEVITYKLMSFFIGHIYEIINLLINLLCCFFTVIPMLGNLASQEYFFLFFPETQWAKFFVHYHYSQIHSFLLSPLPFLYHCLLQ